MLVGFDDLDMNRRDVILGTVGAAVGLAGCSALSSDSDVDLAIFNHTDTAYNVFFEFFDEVDKGRSEARVYETGSSGLQVEAGGQAVREDVVPAGRYLVRYSVYRNNSRLTDQDHIHYYPAGEDDLAFDIHPPGELTRR